MLKNLLLVAMCYLCATSLFAQANQTEYYWADNARVMLTPSSTSFIVTAGDPSVLDVVKADKVKKYESWSHKPYAVVETGTPMTTDQVITALGFDTDEVQVSPGYAQPDGFIIYPTRSVVAKLIDKDDAAEMEQLIGRFGLKTIEKKFGTYRMEMQQLDRVFAAANALQESGIATFAMPDFYAPIQRFQDPLFSQQFQMHNTGQTLDGVAGADDADCNALEAWGITLGSSSITVAVIDDGMEAHEDFVDGNGTSRYTAGFSPANNGNGDAISGSAHGVSCAGSIGASHNGIGVMGVAPLVNFISVNIFIGGESSQDLADAFTWAKNQGADVMSNSWGYGSCTLSFSNLNNAMADANNNGRGGLGSVVVFASGNDYNSCVSYPADYPTNIAVGAFANTGVRSAYSNYGPALDIVAPSNNVGGPGAGVRTTDRMGSAGYASGNYTANFGGTSSACPVVSGVAALVLGYDPSLTSDQVKNVLYTTALTSNGMDDGNQYGAGRVNALGAIQSLSGGGGGPTCTDGIQNGDETGIDCGGSSCPSCPTGCNGTEVTLSITLDNYPEETSWTITNGEGAVVASGGTYGNFADGSTVTETICLSEDCFTFTINDTYGDGICCAYGNGAYTLSNGGTILASGGSFASSEATDFCTGGASTDTQPPSTPANLAVSDEQETQVSLSWDASTDNVGVTGYEVLIDGSVIGTVTGTSVNVVGLTACTAYDFGVRALDAAENVSGTATTSGSTIGCPDGGGGGTEFSEGYFFESGLQGWADGGSDCARVSSSRSFEGSYSVRLRDNSGTASSMTSPTYNLEGLASVSVEFFFYPNSMENGEDFWLRYNDGSGWQTVATYARGTNFQNGQFYTSTVTLDAASFNLTDGARFRFQCDASGNADQIYIDQVTISGSNVSSSTPGAVATIEEVPTIRTFETDEMGEADVEIVPNPATDVVSLRVHDEMREVQVYTMDGKLLMKRAYDGGNQTTLNVSNLPAGIYLIHVVTREETVTDRMVIRR